MAVNPSDSEPITLVAPSLPGAGSPPQGVARQARLEDLSPLPHEAAPSSYVSYDGLFSEHGHRPVRIGLDQVNGVWRVGDSLAVVDDLLTSVVIYRYSHDPFKRLVITRPSLTGLELLVQPSTKATARTFLREVHISHHCLSFFIEPTAAMVWEQVVAAHSARQKQIENFIRYGLLTDPTSHPAVAREAA